MKFIFKQSPVGEVFASDDTAFVPSSIWLNLALDTKLFFIQGITQTLNGVVKKSEGRSHIHCKLVNATKHCMRN